MSNLINKKKICFPFKSNSFGGSHKSSLILIEKLDKKINEPIVVIHRKGIFEKYLIKKKISYKILPLKHIIGEHKGLINLFFSILHSSLKILQFLKHEKISVVHTNDIGMHLTWAIPTYLSKTKLLWHCRSFVPKWNLYKLFSIFPNNILCVSNFVKKSIPNFSKKKSYVIYDPVIFNFSNIKNSKKKFFKKNKYKNYNFIIGCVGNFSIQKKTFDLILLAEKILQKTKKNILFVLVGNDRDYKKKFLIKEINKRNMKKNFLILNNFKPIEVLLKLFDFTFAPAENEGLGRVLIESISTKTPVIANNSGGHKEIVKSNFTGWLYKKNDIHEASKIILNLVSRKKENFISNSAFNFIKNKFDYKKHVRKVVNFY